MTVVRPEDALRQLWNQKGPSLLQDRIAFIGLLNDLSPSFEIERRLLCSALDNGVAEPLARGAGTPLPGPERERLISQLCERSMLQRNACEWVVDAWAWALNRRNVSPRTPPERAAALFTVNPERIRAGDTALLSWDVRTAAQDEVTIDGKRFPAQWEWHVAPMTTTTYVLRAKQGDLRVQESVRLEVTPHGGSRRRGLKPAIGMACGVVLLAVGLQLWFGRGNRSSIEFTARPERLNGPGNVTLEYRVPWGANAELSPREACEDRRTHWICRVESTTRFTLVVSHSGSQPTSKWVDVIVELDQQH
jgi:hypothetical protein